MKNQQGAPEALRPIQRFNNIFGLMNPEARGLYVRYEDHLAALLEAQQPATHVQDQAEIEHVAGDVSKTGPESDMAQQPTPSAAAAVNPDPHAELRKTWQPGQRWQTRTMRHGVWGDWSDTISGRPLWFAHQQYRRHPDEIATQPSPTPQADSQPAMTPETVYAAIAHGDEEHRAWLLSALRAVWCGEAVPPVASPIANAAADSQQAGKSVAIQWLAEMIMSDCGCSTQNQRLLDRIIERITQYERANTSTQSEGGAQAPMIDAEATAYNEWFNGEQGTAYYGMWEFARAAWMARAARATADSQPAPEYVGNGMFKGETIEKAAEHWANWCDVRCMTGLSEFLRVVAAHAPTDSVTAPARPSKPLPYEPTSAMLIAAREQDPALPIETVRAIYWAMWRKAPTPPAQAADSVLEDAAPQAMLSPQVSVSENTLRWWRELATANPQDLVPRIDAHLDAARKQGANHD